MSDPPRAPHPTVETVRRLLRLPGFRSLFVTRIISQLGDGIFQLAGADLLLFKHPGVNPAWTLTKLAGITLLPFSLIVPFVGVFIDRWDRRRILVVTPLLRAGLVALVPLATIGTADRPGFYVIVLLVLSANRFFLATMSAALPQLVDEPDLLVANSVATTGGSIANLVGLGIGAGVSALVGGIQAGMIGGVAFLAAALLARAIPIAGGRPEARVALGAAIARVVREMREGVARVASDRRPTYALGAITAMQLLIGAATGVIASVYIVRLKLGVGSVSALLSFIAVGVFAGVVGVPWIARRVAQARLPSLGFALGGIATVGTGVALRAAGIGSAAGVHSLLARIAIAAGAVVAGIAFAFAKIPVDTIVQETLPDEYRGRAFAAYDMLYNIARVVGTAAAAWAAAAHVGEDVAVAMIGVGYLAASAGTWRRSGRLDMERKPRKQRPVERAEYAFPLAAGELVNVRAHAGYRADEEPRAIVSGNREISIEAVDWSAVEERGGVRRRIFAVRAAGRRMRLAYDERADLWEIERFLPDAAANSEER